MSDPYPEQLPAATKYNVRRLISTPDGDASLLLTPEPILAGSPQEAFERWLGQQSPLPAEDVYRVIEAGTVSRFELKHDTVANYTEVKPPQ